MASQHYIPVDPHKAAQVKALPPRSWRGARELSQMSTALLDGQMIFCNNPKVKPASKTFERRGYQLRRRSDDGGIYYWLTRR